jgi:integrase
MDGLLLARIVAAHAAGATEADLAAKYGVPIEVIRDLVRATHLDVDVYVGELVPAGTPARRGGDVAQAVWTGATPPPPNAPQHVRDNWLPPEAQELILRGKSEHTIKAYIRAFNWWREWAKDNRVTVLPAAQNAQVRFIKDWERLPVHVGCNAKVQANGLPCDGHRPSPSALWIWYSAMKWFHGLGEPPMPWEGGVKLTDAIAGYIKKIKDDGWRAQKAPRAYPQDVTAMVDAVNAVSDLVLAPARRDMVRALILAGYYTGGRASDLARYRLHDIGYFPGGIELTLARSKASKGDRQEEHRTIHRDAENPVYDGVVALERWVNRLQDAGITQGAIFRPVHKSGTIVRGAPDAMAYTADVTGLTRTIRLAARLAQLPGWEKYTIHSLRRGRLQRLLEIGEDIWDVEEALGWAHGGASKAYRAELKRQDPNSANAKGML